VSKDDWSASSYIFVVNGMPRPGNLDDLNPLNEFKPIDQRYAIGSPAWWAANDREQALKAAAARSSSLSSGPTASLSSYSESASAYRGGKRRSTLGRLFSIAFFLGIAVLGYVFVSDVKEKLEAKNVQSNQAQNVQKRSQQATKSASALEARSPTALNDISNRCALLKVRQVRGEVATDELVEWRNDQCVRK
jgi:hypothetical protein